MMIFFATFSLFLVVFLIMAVGYIIQRKRIHGHAVGWMRSVSKKSAIARNRVKHGKPA